MKNPPNIRDAAVVGAYMLSGLVNAGTASSGERQKLLLDTCGDGAGGHIGLVSELCEYAEYALKLCQLGFDLTGDYPGVWEYEVVEPFGVWYAEQLIENENVVTEDEAQTWLRDATFAFFKRLMSTESLWESLTEDLA